ncbi:hypothetical protein ACFQ1I_35970 [Kitasatospora arboriphila]
MATTKATASSGERRKSRLGATTGISSRKPQAARALSPPLMA